MKIVSEKFQAFAAISSIIGLTIAIAQQVNFEQMDSFTGELCFHNNKANEYKLWIFLTKMENKVVYLDLPIFYGCTDSYNDHIKNNDEINYLDLPIGLKILWEENRNRLIREAKFSIDGAIIPPKQTGDWLLDANKYPRDPIEAGGRSVRIFFNEYRNPYHNSKHGDESYAYHFRGPYFVSIFRDESGISIDLQSANVTDELRKQVECILTGWESWKKTLFCPFL